jgi:hypothetical protein
MSRAHTIWAAAICCTAIAWLSGPAGRWLVVLPLLLVGPGYLLERSAPESSHLSAFVRPALWLGLSLSIVALFYAWTTALGLSLTTSFLRVLTALCLVGVIWRSLHRPTNSQVSAAAGEGWSIADRGWWLALLGVLALVLWNRFFQIRDLALPPWVDSVHHALLIRVVIEGGQAPYSLRPYLPIDQLPYHWGYHVFMAAITELSGLSLPRAMLWTGQVLNALHVLTVAGLAAYLWRRASAGVVAGLVVGLLSIMPAYYLSWGRYTQLTGLLLLPALAVVWHAGLRGPSRRWLICTAVLLAGLFLIHVRVLIFALSYLPISAIVWAADKHWSLIRARLWYAGISSALAVGLIAPWLWRLAAKLLMPVVENPSSLVGWDFYNALKPELLWAGQNRLLVALALAFALWGIRHRRRPAVEQVGWVAVLAVFANPWLAGYLLSALSALLVLLATRWRWRFVMLCSGALLLSAATVVRLPSLWLITNDIVVISLFIPIGVLIGGGAAMALSWTDQLIVPPLRRAAHVSVAVALGVLALWGTWNMRDVINPSLVLANQADVAAIEWSAEHTPSDARFLINASPWFPGTPRGTDGGWWLLPLAGRWTSIPPVIYTYDGPTDYVLKTQALDEQLVSFRPGQERQLYELIEQERIDYIYLGAQPGPLSTATFAGDARFETVYSKDGVTILAVHHPR